MIHTCLLNDSLLLSNDSLLYKMIVKVARAAGVRTDDEKKVLYAKIEQLKQQLKVQEDEFAMLSNQASGTRSK